MEFSWFWLAGVLFVTACSAEEELPWWRSMTFYEIYPRSFKDSDGDGVGDIKGIIQKLDHIKEVGADAIWLTPINTSPMKDMGYDVADFVGIDPIFGTMEDFDLLMAMCKQMGIKLLMDYVVNHTSDKHAWFQMSVDPTHPLHKYYRDFYVWFDSKGTNADGTPIPPNNWLSVFGGVAWQWSDQRKQFFLHHFAVEQPDLNFTNPNVVGNMTEVLNFWIEKGIDGFRVDAVDHMFEDPTYPDEQPKEGVVGTDYTWFQVNHTAQLNQPETFKLLEQWTDFLYQKGLEKKREIAMFLEVYAPLEISMRYYGTGRRSLKIPFNFLFIQKISRFSKSKDYKDIIDEWLSSMPKDGVANWVIGNHDVKRIPDRCGPEMVDTLNLLTGILPGVQVVYMGDELGMENTHVPFSETTDPWSQLLGEKNYLTLYRDPSRSPMQWDDSFNAGFSSSKKTWLPVNSNYWRLNVAAQKAAPVSHLKVFQTMARARKDPVMQRGTTQVLAPDDYTLIVVRSYNGSSYTYIANLGSRPVTHTSQSLFSSQGLDMDMSVVVGSTNSDYSPGHHFQKGSITLTLRPKASIVLRSSSSHLIYSAVLLVFSVLVSSALE